MMGRPPRVLKDARALRTTGAFVLVVGVLIFFAGVLVLCQLELLEVDHHEALIVMAVLFLIAGFGVVLLGAEVIRKAVKVAGALKGGVK